MDNMINLLKYLTLQEIKVLQGKIKEEIWERENQVERERIIKDVKDNGYCLSKKKFKIEGIIKDNFIYNLDLYTYDVDDDSYIKIDSPSYKQDDWVKLFDYREKICTKDDDVIPNGDWEKGEDRDDTTYTGTGYIMIYFYYIVPEIPSIGSKYQALSIEEGNIETYIRTDDGIFELRNGGNVSRVCSNDELDKFWKSNSTYIVKQLGKYNDDDVKNIKNIRHHNIFNIINRNI
ncbi:Hypothetical protein ORPV_1155 [Orpheovirus IHUMI-LCC2]|uniref:Uncharacterized protein n=1 Tax=Orpheovirus IHUMI-LCC2 TaxID=2023057 RepID=A0A2I2L6G4_9VIRU|nr:Hypothetical protein ORPV_1155 [Orpheovirus IHUMI-LCC2]SNW63059.1 Hypothetical protein ORPV_1155 [Orpheovirus IHUMI-LCC2]